MNNRPLHPPTVGEMAILLSEMEQEQLK
jgi:hypothetical protein